jgi:pilus assembly protein TadC
VVQQLLASLMFGLSAMLFARYAKYDRLERLKDSENKPIAIVRLQRRLKKRLRLMKRDPADEGWSDFIEGFAIAAFSGIDLGTAFDSARRRSRGTLADELSHVSTLFRGGLRLSRALAESQEISSPQLVRLTNALQRAEILGTPISSVLMSLAEESRANERNRALTRFNTLPLKLSIVTVLFLLPPVLVVTVVPNVLAFLDSSW